MKPNLARGTRDFLPQEMIKRKYIFGVIEKIFLQYGFECIETPAIEQLSTLTGKYGEEGDRLVFKILNSGDFLKDATDADIAHARPHQSRPIISKISEKALRYDLTVPLARFVVMHQNDLVFPFKRYQIQPVWRADRPQKGRYREFYQCDVDTIGSASLFNEAELIHIYADVFNTLGFEGFKIKINHRKLLHGIAACIGADGQQAQALTVALDKMDKVGESGVRQDLENQGFSAEKINILFDIINTKGNFDEKLRGIQSIFEKNGASIQGIQELQEIYELTQHHATAHRHLELDASLARGLDYYTGAIFEVTTPEVPMGSLGGGGRYDNLTEIFGLKNMTGVGISFGAERILDVLNQLNRFPDLMHNATKVLIIALDKQNFGYATQQLHHLRTQNIHAELYPDAAKLKKQMQYANDKKIPYTIIIGENEQNTHLLTLKNMDSGTQQSLKIDEIIEILLKNK